jgi:hypothetical protein
VGLDQLLNNKTTITTVFFPVNGFISAVLIMSAVVNNQEENEPSGEITLIARLTRFVENSDLSFYQIASHIGTSGTILSMWLAGTAKPDITRLGEIEKLLEK